MLQKKSEKKPTQEKTIGEKRWGFSGRIKSQSTRNDIERISQGKVIKV